MSVLYRRLRALACRAWGVAPWEFEERAEAGDVSFEDVLDAVRLESMGMMVGLSEFLFPEREADLQGRHERILVLARELEGVVDADRRAAIEAEIEELNGG
jgi:hypothetical protein